VIRRADPGHYQTMGEALPAPHDAETEVDGDRPLRPDLHERVRRWVEEHFDFIWRSLRRLGVSPGNVDDAAQRVFWIASRKAQAMDIDNERSFLFAIALRVASDERRGARRRPEVAVDTRQEEPRDHAPSPDELLEQRQARALLDEILETMPFELRVVFVLFEIEELTTSEIASLLEIPGGTVASRLRRAREAFEAHVARLRARRTGWGKP